MRKWLRKLLARRKQPKNLDPGQVFEDSAHVWHEEGCTFAVILMSKEPSQNWRCAEFQEWQLGMYERFYDEVEIRMMRYVGNIGELKDL